MTNVLRYDLKRVVQTPRVFRNWPGLLAGLAGEKLHHGGETLTFVTRAGVRLRTPNVPGARLPMYEQFADDAYERAWVLGGTRPLHVLDVGAHVGAFATNVASAGPDVYVDCYEPSPSSAAFLRRNVADNGLGGRVRVHEAAIAGRAGTARLDDNRRGSVHNGLVRDDARLVDGDDAPGARRVIEVRTVTFGDAVAAARAPFDVVKLDCEGGEYELVYTSRPADWAAVQRIVLEYHPVRGESWRELRTHLIGLGFRLVRHSSDTDGLGTAWLERTG